MCLTTVEGGDDNRTEEERGEQNHYLVWCSSENCKDLYLVSRLQGGNPCLKHVCFSSLKTFLWASQRYLNGSCRKQDPRPNRYLGEN